MHWVQDIDLKKTQALAGLAREAVAKAPDVLTNWLSLSRALIALREFGEATACLGKAIRSMPPSPELHLALSEALTWQGLFEEALSHTETALLLAPNDLRAKRCRVELLGSLQRWDEIEADDVAAFSAPMVKHGLPVPPERTLEMCDRLLAADPGHSHAKYRKLIALARLGRSTEANELIALDRLVEVQQLGPPPGYDNEQSFREALVREIRANPTFVANPDAAAESDVLETRRLRQPGTAAVEALLTTIRQAVDAYEERVAASGDQFAIGRPRMAGLHSWAIIYSAAGRQKVHWHPNGWLSGTYYVAGAPSMGEEAYQGPMIMGALDPVEHGLEAPWDTREIAPVPGRLVLFPSYMPHATRASGVDSARICVSFDVQPVANEETTARA
jgi:tetratricopeptide (TPR) repeat protein